MKNCSTGQSASGHEHKGCGNTVWSQFNQKTMCMSPYFHPNLPKRDCTSPHFYKERQDGQPLRSAHRRKHHPAAALQESRNACVCAAHPLIVPGLTGGERSHAIVPLRVRRYQLTNKHNYRTKYFKRNVDAAAFGD